DGPSRMGGGRRLQPRRLRRSARVVLCRLDARDRPDVLTRPCLSPAAARAPLLRTRGGRGAPVPAPLPSWRPRPRLNAQPPARWTAVDGAPCAVSVMPYEALPRSAVSPWYTEQGHGGEWVSFGSRSTSVARVPGRPGGRHTACWSTPGPR